MNASPTRRVPSSRRTPPLSALAFLAFSSLACSSGGGSKAVPVLEASDTASFQATWKPDTVVLDAATVTAKLTNPKATDGVYRFDPSLTEVASMKPGQAMVLSGVDLVKVGSVTVQPDAIVVATEQASLEDAATDANLAWDVAADMSQPLRLESLVPRFGPEAAPSLSCEAPPDGGPCVPKTTFTGTIGNVQVKQTMVINDDGSMTMTSALTVPQQSGSPAVLAVTATAVLHSFRHQGSILVQAGTLTKASFDLSGLDLDLDLKLGAVAIGTGSSVTGNTDSTLRLPIEATVPFALGPLPAYFTLGLTVVMNSTLTSTSSARTHVHYHVGGSVGMAASPAQISGTGKLDSVDGTPPTVSDTETVSTITAGFGLLLEAPRVAFGIGLARVVGTEVYLTGKEEVVVNEAINLDGLGLISGNCTTVNADVGAYAGGNIRIAGLVLKQEKEIYGAVNQVYRGGNPSIAQCH